MVTGNFARASARSAGRSSGLPFPLMDTQSRRRPLGAACLAGGLLGGYSLSMGSEI